MDEIKQNSENFTADYEQKMKEYYIKALKNQNTLPKRSEIDDEGGKIIQPKPECVIKTIDSSGQKVFINITSHDDIAAPKEEHILEMQNQLGIRVPLSLSEKLEDFDNQENICQVYDVIFNSKVVKRCLDDHASMQFLLGLVCERVRQRFNQELSFEAMKRMKNLKYKGKVIRTQRVRVGKGPKIEEIIKPDDRMANNEINTNVKDLGKEVASLGKTPDWNLFAVVDIDRVNNDSIKRLLSSEVLNQHISINDYLNEENISPFDTFNCNPKYSTGIIISVFLPLLTRTFAIDLKASDHSISLLVPKLYSLDLSLPYRIDYKKSISFFDADSRMLIILCRFYDSDIEEFRKTEEKTDDQKAEITDDYLYDVVD